MPLSYPEGFPEAFRVPVVAVNVIAENKLRGLIDKNPDRHAMRTAAVEYIATVACAFGIQACRAAQAGEWPISLIEKVTETEFLRRLLVHTRFEFLGKYYREWEYLADDVMDLVKKREEWAQYKRALIEVASGAGTSEPPPGSADPLRWSDVEITFLSDERVQIRRGAELRTMNYAEFGLEDRRSKKPRLAWATLSELAKGNGSFPRPPVESDALIAAEKRIEELRVALRTLFGISDDDPLPLDHSGGGWMARCRVVWSPAADS